MGVVIFVISVTSWTYMARIVRGQTLSLREKEFVESARSVGASNSRIIFREILPNLTAPIIVYASILVPQVILYEAALSFLGIGVVDQPSWGQMISDATPIFNDAWWYMLFPGLALLFTVLAFNLIGDAMQDALDPKATEGLSWNQPRQRHPNRKESGRCDPTCDGFSLSSPSSRSPHSSSHVGRTVTTTARPARARPWSPRSFSRWRRLPPTQRRRAGC